MSVLHTQSSLLPSRELLVMGGDSAKDQIRALEAGVDIVCGTPGRLDDLITTGKLDLSGVSIVPFLNLIPLKDLEWGRMGVWNRSQYKYRINGRVIASLHI